MIFAFHPRSSTRVLSRTLDHFNVPEREKNDVLGAFAAHKDEITSGWRDAQ